MKCPRATQTAGPEHPTPKENDVSTTEAIRRKSDDGCYHESERGSGKGNCSGPRRPSSTVTGTRLVSRKMTRH
jgi:hypothetical protein